VQPAQHNQQEWEIASAIHLADQSRGKCVTRFS
jgi:hypothetical protein